MNTDPEAHQPGSEGSDDSFDAADAWDAFDADVFTREIENVSASDWDVDTDLLWGDLDAPDDPGADAMSPDFPG